MSRRPVSAAGPGHAATRAGRLTVLLLLAGAAACTWGRPDANAVPTTTPSPAATVAARLPDTATPTATDTATREPATVTATPTRTPTPTASPTATSSHTPTSVPPTAIPVTPTPRPATPTSVPPTALPDTPTPRPATPTPAASPTERPRPLPVPTNPPVAGPAPTVLVLALDGAGRVINFGSGVPVSADGLVVTSQRAVLGARQVAIRQASGAAGTARIVLSDSATGLVVLRATAGQLQVARLGDAAAVHPGDPVIAGGFASSSSAVPLRSVGQVAGPRLWSGGAAGSGTLPFVAGIAPGFTGGPLLDTSGLVVGIVTDPAASGGVASAVPVERARDLIARAQTGGAYPAPAVPQREPTAARPGDSVAAVINRYYDALSAGDYGSAYALLSRSAQASQSYPAFASQFASTAAIEAGAPVIISIDSRRAIAQVQTITTYRAAGGTYRQHWQVTWYLVLEDGEWRRESMDQSVLTAPTPVSG